MEDPDCSWPGDKLHSYGGNLSLVAGGEGGGRRVRGSAAIITGNRVTLHYLGGGGGAVTRLPLAERGWVRLEGGRPAPATRQDMERVLADIQVGGATRARAT